MRGWIKIGIDTGGTFTDFVVRDGEGGVRRWKELSTPDDPTRAIMEGISALFPEGLPQNLEGLIHGTTVGTNAFLERKGPRTVLITTQGMEDLLFIGRQARERLYDLNLRPRRPIITGDHILGLKERMDFEGRPLVPLGAKEVERAYRFVKRKRAESIACMFLHSYANPAHERAVYERIKGLGIHCSISSKVLPRFREYERLSTTLINAYIGPVVGRYISRLTTLLKDTPLFIQFSNGGLQPASSVEDAACQTLLSGPAGGVAGAFELARSMGVKGIITFDMGGTSTDCSICPGSLSYTRAYHIEGYPVALPIIDIHTVGAGGGSIAWIDRGGILRVGPESAGADPGPVCYGKGEDITVTDANCFLGRLLPGAFLGGRMHLYAERVGPRMEALSRRLGLSPIETALGIIKIVNTNMIQALRAISVERGFDPRDFALVTFGGAGGLHAAFLAQELGIKRVIFPGLGGVFSALGMVNSSVTMERARTVFMDASGKRAFKAIKEALEEMRTEIEVEYKGSGATLLKGQRFEERALIEARYRGQSHELEIPFDTDWIDHFHHTHKRLYGYASPDANIEVTGLRLILTLVSDEAPAWGQSSGWDRQIPSKTPIHFDDGLHLTPCRYRAKLKNGEIEKGPLLVLDDYTTILCPVGWMLRSQEGHLIMEQLEKNFSRR